MKKVKIFLDFVKKLLYFSLVILINLVKKYSKYMTKVQKKANTNYHKSHATIWLPKDIHKEVKIAAATSGLTIKEFFIQAIRRSLINKQEA